MNSGDVLIGSDGFAHYSVEGVLVAEQFVLAEDAQVSEFKIEDYASDERRANLQHRQRYDRVALGTWLGILAYAVAVTVLLAMKVMR